VATWNELRLLILLLIFAIHQIRDICRAQRKRYELLSFYLMCETNLVILNHPYTSLHIRSKFFIQTIIINTQHWMNCLGNYKVEQY
jgi:hypothetical protein